MINTALVFSIADLPCFKSPVYYKNPAPVELLHKKPKGEQNVTALTLRTGSDTFDIPIRLVDTLTGFNATHGRFYEMFSQSRIFQPIKGYLVKFHPEARPILDDLDCLQKYTP